MKSLAVGYMKRGWPVFPVVGKVPAIHRGVLAATTDLESVVGWTEGATGVGLATGAPSGVFVVDLDGTEARDAFFALAKAEGGRFEGTVSARTGRGWHLFFKMPEGTEVRNSASKILPHVDVRGTGGYVVLPGSEHPDGGQYTWQPGAGLEDREIAEAPGWLIRRLTQQTPLKFAADTDGTVIEGARNETLTSLAGSMRRRGMSEAAMLAALRTENGLRCDPPLDDAEVQAIARSVGRYNPVQAARAGDVIRATQDGLELIDAAVLERISMEKQAPVSACPVPFGAWKAVCTGAGGQVGLAHGWHVVVGAPSGAGKSLFATNFAAHAIRSGQHVCLMSLEMTQSEVVTRLLAIYNNFPVRSLEHGQQFDPRLWQEASERLQEAQGSIRINRDSIRSLADIRACFERHVADGCRVFITDYLQLAWVQDAASMREQITEVSHALRGLAKEYDVLSFGLSQLNRAMTTSGGTFSKEGLIGGSSLENDADQVLLLSKQERTERGFKSTCKLDKNRHGMVTEFDLMLATDTLRLRHVDELGMTKVEEWER